MAYKKVSQIFNTPKGSKMEELLSRQQLQAMSRGEVVEARIVSISNRQVFLDLGGKSEGIIEGREFDAVRDFLKTLSIDDRVRVTVVIPETQNGLTLVSLREAAGDHIWGKVENYIETGKSIMVTVRSVVKGGLAVDFQNISGFIPLSQVGALALVDIDELVGRQLEVVPIEASREKNRILFSERGVSEKDQIEKQKKVITTLSSDEIFEGEVVNSAPFGVFVRIVKDDTPIEGLVHSSRVGDVEEFLPGKKVSVRVIGTERGKVAFDLILNERDVSKYEKDMKVKGKVLKMNQKNAMVELEPGVSGTFALASVPAGMAVRSGETHDFFIENVDRAKRRITLGLALKAKPIGYK